MGVVPYPDRRALDDLMGVAAEANGTGGIDPTGCACLKVHPPGSGCGLLYGCVFGRVSRTLRRDGAPAIGLLLTRVGVPSR